MARVRRLGAAMEIEDSIVQLGAKLDAWWARFSTMLHSEDRAAQGKALLQGFDITKQFDRLKADGLAALAALLNPQDTGAVPQAERAAPLLQGFVFGAKLASTLHDEFRDTKTETEVVQLMLQIVNALDAVDPERVALAKLLDDSDPRVQVFAGAHMIKSMPERVIPILREIKEKEDANSAHFNAYFALLIWEHEGKHAAANK
jgi:hypothetical protein